MRKTSLMVLTHLILNDMMKVKGHVAALALRLRDDEPRIAALAALFFHELANKACKARARPVPYTCNPCLGVPAAVKPRRLRTRTLPHSMPGRTARQQSCPRRSGAS